MPHHTLIYIGYLWRQKNHDHVCVELIKTGFSHELSVFSDLKLLILHFAIEGNHVIHICKYPPGNI